MRNITTPNGHLLTAPIWVDFRRCDWNGCLILDCPGTVRDLAAAGVKLVDGMLLVLYEEDADEANNIDDLIAVGTARFDPDEGRWIAESWEPTVHASELDPDAQSAYNQGRDSQRRK